MKTRSFQVLSKLEEMSVFCRRSG